MNKNFSDYIVYVDESGDHALSNINKEYPIFVLAFCIFDKQKYTQSAVKKIKELKFKYFGHDGVILHENDIRRDKGWFKILKTKEIKEDFLSQLTQIIKEEDFTLIATVIKKDKLFSYKNNPYDTALKYCMERLYKFLSSKKQEEKITHVMVEKRGKNEDKELELEFRRVCDGKNFENIKYPFEIIMMDKLSNSAGLQFADLVARPIGLSVFKPHQANRTYEILKDKMYKNSKGEIKGCGLKIFP